MAGSDTRQYHEGIRPALMGSLGYKGVRISVRRSAASDEERERPHQSLAAARGEGETDPGYRAGLVTDVTASIRPEGPERGCWRP